MTTKHEPIGRRRRDARYLGAALVLIALYMVVEVVVSLLSGSLALLADAGHMLVDAGAIAGSLWALRLAERPTTATMSYGLKRAEILAAAINGVTLTCIGIVLAVYAVIRLVHPVRVEGVPMIVVAAIGVAVNLVVVVVIGRADQHSLNVHSVFAHVVTDVYGYVATLVAGIVIVATGWSQADSLATLIVVIVVLYAAAKLLRASGRILLEGTPESVNLVNVTAHLESLPGVIGVHDLHAWTLTSDLPVLTAHVVVDSTQQQSTARILDELQACLADHFDVEHSTFQIEELSHEDHEHKTHD